MLWGQLLIHLAQRSPGLVGLEGTTIEIDADDAHAISLATGGARVELTASRMRGGAGRSYRSLDSVADDFQAVLPWQKPAPFRPGAPD
jgi:hypothetical protein